jgi:hypothetical protein
VRGRERLQALLQRGTGDVQRVDRIRLAALTGTPARLRGQVRRDPQHPLAALDEKPLQRPGDMPAVLKRPHPLAVEAARPPQQDAEPAPADRDRSLAQQLAGHGRDRRDRVRTLVSVRAKHDHDPRPPLDASRADVWWTRLARGDATHPSSHARHPRPATSDKTQESQAQPGRQPQSESARRPVGTLSSWSDVTDRRNENSKPHCGSDGAQAASDRELARVEVVPRHRMHWIRPNGASVARPLRAPATAPVARLLCGRREAGRRQHDWLCARHEWPAATGLALLHPNLRRSNEVVP